MATFFIHYKTTYGERLGMYISDPKGHRQLVQLVTNNGEEWYYDISVSHKKAACYRYKYVLMYDDGQQIREWGPQREATIGSDDDTVFLDRWRIRNTIQNSFLTSAFTEAIYKRGRKGSTIKSAKNSLTFSLFSTGVSDGYEYGVVGSTPELGSWSVAQPMSDQYYPYWKVNIPIAGSADIEYKYVILDSKTKNIVSWEVGENRHIHLPRPSSHHHVVDDIHFRNGGQWRGSGVAIPVFSLRTSQSFGIGEFKDLNPLVSWSKDIGMNIIQVLPINDTIANRNWQDSYPYAAISIMALHPLYIHIPSIAPFKDGKLAQAYAKDLAELNALEFVDFDRVLERKFYYFRKIYDQVKSGLDKDKEFQYYINEHKSWLYPYAAFCFLRDKHDTCNFTQWGEHASYNAKDIQALFDVKHKDFDAVSFYIFLQYHADKQLLEVKQNARNHGVVLKGDLPIGIYRYSCDAWIAPDLYNMAQQAGAPPDDYAEMGQNWGFPTYNWDIMAQDGYEWWRSRMLGLNRYFDALRIDHILGFFRIWQIPLAQKQGTLGLFNPRLPYSRSELERFGIHGDLSRYTDPYITEDIVQATFGSEAKSVQEVFLQSKSYGLWIMKDEFKTQQQVSEYITNHKKYAAYEKGLHGLIANVLLLVEQDGNHFNPRITVNTTISYQALDDRSKACIMAAYNEYYFRRHNEYWRDQAMERLPALLDASDMMICGEDLGMIPDTVPGVMKALNIISLEIQRMPKGAAQFGQVMTYPYDSVCSPSCHDMSTIRGWWQEDHDNAKKFYYDYLHRGGLTPLSCNTDIVRDIVAEHMASPSILAIFPLQDLVGMHDGLRKGDAASEQINIPANPKHYWRYRFHIDLEQLTIHDEFKSMVRDIVAIRK
jgi:4-alpha-glucanotransferase